MLFIHLRERVSKYEWGRSRADSLLSRKPSYAGSAPFRNSWSMTLVKGRCLTYWDTRVPLHIHFRIILLKSSKKCGRILVKIVLNLYVISSKLTLSLCQIHQFVDMAFNFLDLTWFFSAVFSSFVILCLK